METKSRYEIIAELEEKKAKLINVRASIDLRESQLAVEVEKAEELLKAYVTDKGIQIANVNDQLESLERSLERFNSQKTKN